MWVHQFVVLVFGFTSLGPSVTLVGWVYVLTGRAPVGLA